MLQSLEKVVEETARDDYTDTEQGKDHETARALNIDLEHGFGEVSYGSLQLSRIDPDDSEFLD